MGRNSDDKMKIIKKYIYESEVRKNMLGGIRHRGKPRGGTIALAIFFLIGLMVLSSGPFNFAYAASTAFTYDFAATSEGWVGQGSTDVTNTYASGTGNPAGSLQTRIFARNKVDATAGWLISGITWEDLGVPVGATVTQVDGSYSWQCSEFTTGNAASTSGDIIITDNTDTNATTLETGVTFGATTTWATQDASGAIAIPAAIQASNSSIKIKAIGNLQTANNASAAVTRDVDVVSLTITYTAAAPVPTVVSGPTASAVDTGTHVDGTFSITARFNDNGGAISGCEYTTDGSAWSAGTVSGSGATTDCDTTGATCTEGADRTINMRATNAGGTTTATAITRTCDTTAPSTTPAATGYTFNTWSNTTPISVNLATITETGSGVASQDYCVDTADSCAPGTTYAGAFDVTCGTTCTQYVRYTSDDNVGNTETVTSVIVKQDLEAPTISTFTAATGGADGEIDVSWAATDPGTGSGMHGTTAYIVRRGTNAGDAAPGDCASGTAVYSGTAGSPTTVGGLTLAGTYNFRICAYDALNNMSTTTASGVAAGSPPTTTTLTDGTDPGATTVCPADTGLVLDAFTLTESSSNGIASVDMVTIAFTDFTDISTVYIKCGAGPTTHEAATPTGNLLVLPLTTSISVPSGGSIDCTIEADLSTSAAGSVDAAISAFVVTGANGGVTDNGTSHTISADIPAQVTNFNAVDAEDGQVTLNWTSPGDNSLVGYTVCRKDSGWPTSHNDCAGWSTYVANAQKNNARSEVDNTVTNGLTYYYAVFHTMTCYNETVTDGQNANTGLPVGVSATQTLDAWADLSADEASPFTDKVMAKITTTAANGGVALISTNVTLAGDASPITAADDITVWWNVADDFGTATEVGTQASPTIGTPYAIDTTGAGGAGSASGFIFYSISLPAGQDGNTFKLTVTSVTGSTADTITLAQTTAFKTAQAPSAVYTITSCNDCHGSPASDDPGGLRNPTTGEFKGSHGQTKHQNLYPGYDQCLACHEAPIPVSYGHRGGTIAMNSTSIYGIGGSYYDKDNSSTHTAADNSFAQSNSPTYGYCRNVTCHGTGTPQWGTSVMSCTSCHNDGNDTASITNSAPATGLHVIHVKETDYVDCNKCHGTSATTGGHAGHQDGSNTVAINPGDAASDITDWTDPSCTNNCHATTADTWAGGSVTCTDCHSTGYLADTAGSMPTTGLHITLAGSMTSGQPHDDNFTDGSATFTCEACHTASPSTKHMDNVNDASYNTIVINTGTVAIGAFVDGATPTCTSQCHSDNEGWARRWSNTADDNTADECSNCHGVYDVVGFATGMIGNHAGATVEIKHDGTNKCVTCHAYDGADTYGYATASSHRDGAIQLNEQLTVVDVGTEVGCSDCHGTGLQYQFTSTKIGQGGANRWTRDETLVGPSADCDGCHATEGALHTDGSESTTTHNIHNGASTTYITGCIDCHGHNGPGDGNHFNGDVNFATKISVPALYDENAGSFGGTCTNSCHDSDAGDYVAGNLGTDACIDCHLTAGVMANVPSSGLHATTAVDMTSQQPHDDNFTDGSSTYTCEACHTASPSGASHKDGTADASYPTIVINTGTVAINAFVDGATPTCTSQCHSDNEGWARKWSATADDNTAAECANCHGDYASGWVTGVISNHGGATVEIKHDGTDKCVTCHAYDGVTDAYSYTANNSHRDGAIQLNEQITVVDVGTEVGCSDCHGTGLQYQFTSTKIGQGGANRWTRDETLVGPAASCDGCHTGNAGHGHANEDTVTHTEIHNSVTSTYIGSCADCHAHNGPGTAGDGVHADDTVNFANRLSNTYDYDVLVSNFQGTCVSVNGCHDSSADEWTTQSLGGDSCADCHASAGTLGTVAGNAYPPTSGTHALHIAANVAYVPTDCDDCHGADATTGAHGANHKNGTVEDILGYVAATTNCTNSCHDSDIAADWTNGNLGADDCADCHATALTLGVAAGGVYPPTSAKHTEHIGANTAFVPTDCDSCHGTDATTGAHGVTHKNNAIDDIVTYASGTQTCDAGSCHTADTSGDWTAGGALACVDCHVTGMIGAGKHTSGLHIMSNNEPHNENVTGGSCETCHTSTPSATHVDNTLDTPVINTGEITTYNTGTPPTCAATCHSDGGDWERLWSTAADLTETTVGSDRCDVCHGQWSSLASTVSGWRVGTSHITNPTRGETQHEEATPSCDMCHGYATATGNHNTATHRISMNSNGATPERNGTNAGCANCHGGMADGTHNFPESTFTMATVTGPVLVGGDCDTCHDGVVSSNYVTRDIMGVTDGTGDFTMASRHVWGAVPTKYDCVICHMEGDASGTATALHMNDTVEMKHADTLASTGSWDKTAQTPAMHSQMDTFCLSCHDANGASGISVNIDGTGTGTAYALQPFLDNLRTSPSIAGSDDFSGKDFTDLFGMLGDQTSCEDVGFTWTGSACIGERSRVMDVKSQFDSGSYIWPGGDGSMPGGFSGGNYDGNPSQHAVMGPRYNTNNANWTAWVNPAGGLKSGQTLTTVKEKAQLHCADCHSVATNAHGSANSYMITAASVDASCFGCHPQDVYDYNTATNQNISRFDHVAADASIAGETEIGASFCLNCHGGAPQQHGLGGIHGLPATNDYRFAQQPYRFIGGAVMVHDALGWTTAQTTSNCYFDSDTKAPLSTCAKHKSTEPSPNGAADGDILNYGRSTTY